MVKEKYERFREATDDREDYYAVGEGNRIKPTKLGWTVAAVVVVLALIGLGVVIF